MNIKSITLAAVLSSLAFAAAAAPATEGAIGSEPVAVSQKSRADVRAELTAALKDGSYQIANEAYATSSTPFVSTLSRAEVRQEARIAAHSAQRSQLEYLLYIGG